MGGPFRTVKLREIAYARSGDKGSSANVGVIAYSPEGYRFLRGYLTTERLRRYLESLQPTGIERYELPNLGALNFVLKGILQGGGSRSLRVDAQGKALAVAVLEMEVEVPAELYPRCVRR